MKLNEITPELIDEMLSKYPIRGILTFKTLQKVETIIDNNVSFHSGRGWFYFSKEDLKETERHFREEYKDDVIEIKQTNKGYIYCFTGINTIAFFCKKGRQGTLKANYISMDFSDGINRSDRHGFLLSKGVECFVRKYIIPFKNGEMRLGHWHEEYISATDKKQN
ncbi:hypothetical protein HHL23_09630 [Chryseobacterium sp. RP-3-3]|uniref:Uncharacterized protein n=1 Tax=Chryseobacterium antibioticum TaxID=2728847 RepID=A0A7Y0AMH8_9FLAO|nr:hypothetical protein [Chryseobacterium antibioticum]NML70061.1 hypothetical protein [Chryseobacterium antibioticum]